MAPSFESLERQYPKGSWDMNRLDHFALWSFRFFSDMFQPPEVLDPCRSKEIKNGVLGNWSSATTALGIFQHVSYEQLVVGHTHEDIGTWTQFIQCSLLHA